MRVSDVMKTRFSRAFLLVCPIADSENILYRSYIIVNDQKWIKTGVKGILWDFFIFTLEQIIVLKINIVPKTNLFPKYHISKHYRTHVKYHRMRYKKINKKDKK